MNITEQLIMMAAPNSGAVANGRKISQKNDFSGLKKSADETLIWGDCAGSGKNPYRTSADFIDPDAPVFRCSCPSRQFPCKHALGLLFDWLAGKTFETAEIPQDIADKRAKKEARAEKAAEKKEESAPKKVNTAARTKKLKKQLEGLDMAEKMVNELLTAGLNTLAGTAVSTYQSLAKELGNYYLPGPQLLVSRMVMEMEAIQDKPEEASRHYRNATRLLLQLSSTIQKARAYLEDKMDKGEVDTDYSILYEALGGIWKLDELEGIGAMRENVPLVQLSFDVSYDEARKEYIDRGYWMDLTTGRISQSLQYRPVKALKYVKEEDTNFGLLTATKLYTYPGELNCRIRWDGAVLSPVTAVTLRQIKEKAQPDVAAAAKLLKNQIKNTLSPKYAGMLLAFSRIGRIGDETVLEDKDGGRIRLLDMPDMPQLASVYRLSMLPDRDMLHNQALFGLLFYDEESRSICMQPYSLVTDTAIVRLQY